MRIENLTKIIEGELLNSPSITYIDQIRTNPKQVKRGDAFLTVDKQDIDIAIKNGAYAVIFTGQADIKDSEIAWIRVEDIQKSVIRYLRFKIVQSGFDVYYAEDVTYQILKSSVNSKNILFLDEDIISNFIKIINADIDTLFVSNMINFVKEVNPLYKEIKKCKKNFVEPIKFSLFQMDIVCDDIYHKEIRVPKIFLPYLNDSINFLKEHGFSYNLPNIKIESHFDPIFIDNEFNIKDFGDTNRVLILESDKNLIKDEIEYLCKYAKYAKNSALLPRDLGIKAECLETIEFDADFDISILKGYNSNFFLINENREKIIKKLALYQKEKYKRLF